MKTESTPHTRALHLTALCVERIATNTNPTPGTAARIIADTTHLELLLKLEQEVRLAFESGAMQVPFGEITSTMIALNLARAK